MKYNGLENGKFHIHFSDWDRVQLHGHGFLEFTFVARGEIDHHIDGHTDRVHSGGYFIVDHGTSHSYERVSAEPLWVISFLFYPEFLDRALVSKRGFEDILGCYLLKFSYKTLKEPVTGRVFYDTDGAVRKTVEEIVQEYERQDYGYLEWIRCQFVKILIITMRGIGQKNADISNEIVVKITDIVKERYSEKLRFNDIARELGYSVGYLSSMFSRVTGMRFFEYLQKIRVEQACRILQSTAMTIPEVAHAVGVNDIKFFNRIFKEQLGLAPSQYRKLHK